MTHRPLHYPASAEVCTVEPLNFFDHPLGCLAADRYSGRVTRRVQWCPCHCKVRYGEISAEKSAAYLAKTHSRRTHAPPPHTQFGNPAHGQNGQPQGRPSVKPVSNRSNANATTVPSDLFILMSNKFSEHLPATKNWTKTRQNPVFRPKFVLDVHAHQRTNGQATLCGRDGPRGPSWATGLGS